MIDDIVELPRRLMHFRPCGCMTSVKPYFIPESRLGEMIGGVDRNPDEDVIGLGWEFEVMTGNDCPFRYKFIENRPAQIVEYFAVSDGPMNSPQSRFFTLWRTIVDKASLLASKQYYWTNIRAAIIYFYQNSPCILSELMQHEVEIHGPHLARLYGWAHEHPFAISAEDKEILRMLMLQRNINIFDAEYPNCYRLDPMDIYRGLYPHTPSKRMGEQLSSRILGSNVVYAKDIRGLVSPRFQTKPFHQCPREINDPIEGTDLTGERNEKHYPFQMTEGWFDVLKYIELIPYGEFFVALSFPDKGIDNFTVYNSYDPGTKKSISENELSTYVRKTLNMIMDAFDCSQFESTKMFIYRSWSEEVYITFQNSKASCETTRLYFDMTYAAIGSRMLCSEA